jgi:hypothetical protein
MKEVMDPKTIKTSLVNSRCNAKNIKNRAKGQEKGKDKAFTCHKCGGPNHFAKK